MRRKLRSFGGWERGGGVPGAASGSLKSFPCSGDLPCNSWFVPGTFSNAFAGSRMLPSIILLCFLAIRAFCGDTNLPIQSSTIGVGTNVTLKGIAIRVGDNHNAAVCFDTELVRVSG